MDSRAVGSPNGPGLVPATLGSSSSSTGYTYVLGTCTLEVVGIPSVYPAQPNPDESLNWASDQLEMNLPVWMADHTTWTIAQPPVTQQDGRIKVQLRGPRRATATFNVAADCVSEKIWNVGFPVPQPEPEPEPVIVPDPPEPTPLDPTVPPVVVDPSEGESEPPADPLPLPVVITNP